MVTDLKAITILRVRDCFAPLAMTYLGVVLRQSLSRWDGIAIRSGVAEEPDGEYRPVGEDFNSRERYVVHVDSNEPVEKQQSLRHRFEAIGRTHECPDNTGWHGQTCLTVNLEWFAPREEHRQTSLSVPPSRFREIAGF